MVGRGSGGRASRSNTSKVPGLDLFSIGQFEPLDGSHIVVQDTVGSTFFHFVFLDGRLVGSILLRDATAGPALKKAIEARTSFSRHLSRIDVVQHLREMQ